MSSMHAPTRGPGSRQRHPLTWLVAILLIVAILLVVRHDVTQAAFAVVA